MFRKIVVIVIAAVVAAAAAMAGEMEGKKIRSKSENGLRLEYRLIDMKARARARGIGITPQMKSHHLMLYVIDEQSGEPVTNGRAGYLVKAPGRGAQKVMAMKMGKGYGGDVDLAPGANRVKVKFVSGSKKVIDEFTINR